MELIKFFYPSNKQGRLKRGFGTILRMYLLKRWFKLSDVGVDENIDDSSEMRSFMRIDCSFEQIPDATTLLKYRHLLEEDYIGEKIFEDVKSHLE